MKVLVIGAGNMGLTYSEGMATSSLLNRRKLMIYDLSAEVTDRLKKTGLYDVHEDIEKAVKIADIIFIAVKPYHSEDLFEKIKPFTNDQQIAVSLMAGVTIDTIQNQLGIPKVVRTMPNLPAKVGKGVTSFSESKEVRDRKSVV